MVLTCLVHSTAGMGASARPGSLFLNYAASCDAAGLSTDSVRCRDLPLSAGSLDSCCSRVQSIRIEPGVLPKDGEIDVTVRILTSEPASVQLPFEHPELTRTLVLQRWTSPLPASRSTFPSLCASIGPSSNGACVRVQFPVTCLRSTESLTWLSSCDRSKDALLRAAGFSSAREEDYILCKWQDDEKGRVYASEFVTLEKVNMSTGETLWLEEGKLPIKGAINLQVYLHTPSLIMVRWRLSYSASCCLFSFV